MDRGVYADDRDRLEAGAVHAVPTAAGRFWQAHHAGQRPEVRLAGRTTTVSSLNSGRAAADLYVSARPELESFLTLIVEFKFLCLL